MSGIAVEISAPYKVAAYHPKKNGQTWVSILCGMCTEKVRTAVWSLSGSGKRCPACLSVHSSYGKTYLYLTASEKRAILNGMSSSHKGTIKRLKRRTIAKDGPALTQLGLAIQMMLKAYPSAKRIAFDPPFSKTNQQEQKPCQ